MSAVENNQSTTKSEEITIPKDPLRPVAIRPLASAARDKALFEDSLLDSTIGQRKRRTWATGLSFALQIFFIAFLAFASVMVHRCVAKGTISHFSGSPTSSATPAATSGVHPTRGESGEGNQQHRERAAAHSKQNPGKSPDD